MHAGTISYGGRNCNHRLIHQTTNHTGKGTFHSGHRHHTIGTLNRFQSGQQTMQSTHTHIINPFHMGAKIFRGLGRLLRYGDIRRSRRTHHDFSHVFLFLLDLQNVGIGIIDYLGKPFPDQFILSLTCPGAKYFSV